MNPDTELRLQRVEQLLAALVKSDRYNIEKLMQFADGKNVQVGRTLGLQIATANDQKLGFWGTIPVVQPAAIADHTGGGGGDNDGTARTKINLILAALRLPGLIDT